MRHLKKGKKLNRTAAHRKALFRNMSNSLFLHERIQTTDAKAKALRSVAEKLITLAKKGDLHARRMVFGRLRDHDVIAKLFSDIAPRYMSRPGGYTRIIKAGIRHGDNAPLSIIELVADAAPAPVAEKGEA